MSFRNSAALYCVNFFFVLFAFQADGLFGGILSNGVFRVEVAANGKTGFLEIPATEAVFDGADFTWPMAASADIIDTTGSEALATVLSGFVAFQKGAVLTLAFSVLSKSSETEFRVTSPIVEFAPVYLQGARANSSFVIVDLDGGGSSVVGGFNGSSKSFRAGYDGAVTTDTMFAEIGPNLAGGPFSAQVATGQTNGVHAPPSDTQTTAVQTEFSFSIQSGDLATGVGVFVVPEPELATWLLFGGTVALALRFGRPRLITKKAS